MLKGSNIDTELAAGWQLNNFGQEQNKSNSPFGNFYNDNIQYNQQTIQRQQLQQQYQIQQSQEQGSKFDAFPDIPSRVISAPANFNNNNNNNSKYPNLLLTPNDVRVQPEYNEFYYQNYLQGNKTLARPLHDLVKDQNIQQLSELIQPKLGNRFPEQLNNNISEYDNMGYMNIDYGNYPEGILQQFSDINMNYVQQGELDQEAYDQSYGASDGNQQQQQPQMYMQNPNQFQQSQIPTSTNTSTPTQTQTPLPPAPYQNNSQQQMPGHANVANNHPNNQFTKQVSQNQPFNLTQGPNQHHDQTHSVNQGQQQMNNFHNTLQNNLPNSKHPQNNGTLSSYQALSSTLAGQQAGLPQNKIMLQQSQQQNQTQAQLTIHDMNQVIQQCTKNGRPLDANILAAYQTLQQYTQQHPQQNQYQGIPHHQQAQQFQQNSQQQHNSLVAPNQSKGQQPAQGMGMQTLASVDPNHTSPSLANVTSGQFGVAPANAQYSQRNMYNQQSQGITKSEPKYGKQNNKNYERKGFNNKTKQKENGVSNSIELKAQDTGSLNGSQLPFKYANIDEVLGQVQDIARDQNGCRFLQKQIDEGGQETIIKIFGDVLSDFTGLMMDPFGNYLVQKLLDCCEDDQRLQIVQNLASSNMLVSVAQNTHGTRAVQKLVESLKSQEEVSYITGALKAGVVELIKDLNGNHVIQRCLQKLNIQDCQFIYNAVVDKCMEVACHRHGCCVLQRCIDFASEEQRSILLVKISHHALDLAKDAYGNYVVQYLMQRGDKTSQGGLLNQLRGNFAELSLQKFSSNVVERCLKLNGDNAEQIREMVVREIIVSQLLARILQDAYGNYVVQSALQQSRGKLNNDLITAIQPHVPILRGTPYGKRILQKVNGKN